MPYDFSDHFLDYQSRHLVLKEISLAGVEKIKKAKVLVVGLGGLGSVVALYLAHSGVGELGICDYDQVELSNLGRQITYSLNDLQKPKAAVVEKLLKAKNQEIKITPYFQKINQENFYNLTQNYDLIVEAVDDTREKVLIHDLAVRHQKPLVHAGVLGFKGQLLTIIPGETACLRCFFHDLSDFSASGNCARDGVFSPLVGVLGALQASEALKFFALKKENLQVNALLQVDLLEQGFRKISINYPTGCQFCVVKN